MKTTPGERTHWQAHNEAVYRGPDVVSYYAVLAGLTDCERFLFGRWLRPGMRILDLGVGGGRTTPYLSALASTYVGLDVSEAMLKTCRARFTDLAFVRGDAAALDMFGAETFDAVVFAFNGLDYLYPAARRLACLAECARVLVPGGIFLFSVHNAEAVAVAPVVERDRVTVLARRWARPESPSYPAVWMGLFLAKIAWVGAGAIRRTLGRAARRLPTRLFWRGDGYFVDPAHGGLMTRAATRDRVGGEIDQAGFELLDVVGDAYPRRRGRYVTEWYYYACRKHGEGWAGS